ncbi:MAG: hypothetical protein LBQ54_03010, partial [Planctomycetaceae bacterium]|nr:hypothetical protein [Planctomycetaceae bacterium]
NLPGIEKRIEEASAENPSTSAEAVPAEPPPLPSEAVPAETSVPVELPAPVEPPAPEAAPAENPSSRMENRSLFVPVVYQTESETAASETVEEPPIEPPSEQSPEPSPTAEAPAAEPSPSEPETPVAAVPPTAETPAEQPVTEGIPVSEETALVPEVPDAADESVKKSKEEPLPPYKPLSEVADNIKVILARLKMNETLERIEQRMNEHYEEMNIYARRAADAVSGKEAAAAPVLDLKKIAEENGLVYKTAGMVDFYEMYKSDPDFAASVIDSAQFSQRTVLEMMYDASGLVESYPYRAINVTDNNRYLFRVTGVREQKTPDFNDPGVKEIVLKRWKEVKARPLAQEKAKQLAEAAKKSGKPLQEYFEAAPDPVVKRIVETDYFSWYEEPVFSYYQMPRLRLSEVRESGVEMGKAELQNKVIVAWGNTFMEDVFALQKGDYGTTVNQPQNTYYVVHVLEVTPTNEELVSLFNESPTQRSYISFFVLQDQFAAIQEAIDRKIQTVTHFKWLETPTAYNERLRNQEQRE